MWKIKSDEKYMTGLLEILLILELLNFFLFLSLIAKLALNFWFAQYFLLDSISITLFDQSIFVCISLLSLKLCFHVYTCTYAYPYHIKTGLKIWSVSFHSYAHWSSIWILLWAIQTDDGSFSCPWTDRVPLMTWISN